MVSKYFDILNNFYFVTTYNDNNYKFLKITYVMLDTTPPNRIVLDSLLSQEPVYGTVEELRTELMRRTYIIVGSRSLGTAFMVNHEYALTCAHVLFDNSIDCLVKPGNPEVMAVDSTYMSKGSLRCPKIRSSHDVGLIKVVPTNSSFKRPFFKLCLEDGVKERDSMTPLDLYTVGYPGASREIIESNIYSQSLFIGDQVAVFCKNSNPEEFLGSGGSGSAIVLRESPNVLKGLHKSGVSKKSCFKKEITCFTGETVQIDASRDAFGVSPILIKRILQFPLVQIQYNTSSK